MSKYIFRRFLWMFLVLFVVSVITFILMHQIPGGPFDREKPLPQPVIDMLEAKYNLDDPLYIQYVTYISNIVIPTLTEDGSPDDMLEDYLININLPGDQTFSWMNFGPSYNNRTRTVNDIFRENLPVSLELGVYALTIACIIGIPLGILSAIKKNSFYDYGSMGVAILGVSIPIITLGPVLRYVFGVELQWVPPTGWGTWQHAIMPAFALGFAQSALLARLTRASLLQVLDEDYIRTARAKGISERAVIGVHGLKNSMIPVVTILGPLFAALVTGTFVTERIFAVPGMGKYFVDSVNDRDYPVIMGTILLYAAFLVIANLVVDIMYAWLDPRIRYD
jgi:ABC-type dipeptide/oligopeptide/nickel transport system permease component